MTKGNDQVFQLSLTEIAFTIAFLLLLLLGYLVFKEQMERHSVEDKLAKVQTAASATAMLNQVKSQISAQLQQAGTTNPNEIISKLVASEMVRTERDQLRRQVDNLDAKLTALTELKKQLEETAASRRPEVTQEKILSALTLQHQWRQIMPTHGKEITSGEESQIIKNVVAAAKSCEDLSKAGQNPESIKKENSDLRGQVAFLKNRLDARGGRDYPPCWADETGQVEYLFSVEVRPDFVAVSPAWPGRREAAAKELPGIDAILAEPHSNQAFVNKIQAIFNWSKNQNPECRHYVKLKSSISDAVQSDRARLMVENFFYKMEARR